MTNEKLKALAAEIAPEYNRTNEKFLCIQGALDDRNLPREDTEALETAVEAVLLDVIEIEVHLLAGPNDRLNAPGCDWSWSLPRRFWKDANGDCTVSSALNAAFRQGNHVDGTEYVDTANSGLRCRSMSVGDLVTVKMVDFRPQPEGAMVKTKTRYFRCEGCGWSELSRAAYIHAARIPSRDASFGLEWLAERGKFPADCLADVTPVAA